MNRRSIALILIGTITALLGLYLVTLLRGRRCAAAGGRWDAARGICGLPGGADPGTASLGVGGYLLAVTAAVLVGAALLWVFRRAGARTPPSSAN